MYVTVDNLLRRFDPSELERLTDGTGGTPDPTIVAEAIAAASSVVDAALAGAGYQLPLASPYPDVIVDVTSYLAIERLYARQPSAELPPPLERLIDWAYAWLTALITGAVVLPPNGGGQSTGAYTKSLSSRPSIIDGMNSEY